MDATRTDRWSNTLTIDGVPIGRFDTLKGGDNKAATTTHLPGGMQPAIPIGAPAIPSQITMEKYLDLDSDWDTICFLMRARVGKAVCTATRTPLDSDGRPKGQPLVYTGLLDNALPGDTDSTKPGIQMWSIVFTPAGSIG